MLCQTRKNNRWRMDPMRVRESLYQLLRVLLLCMCLIPLDFIYVCVCVDIIRLLVFISFVSGKVDWCKFVYLIVMKFEKLGEFEMFWKHLFDNGMLCMNMGGNSCLLVGSVSCQLMTIRLYGLTLTQQVVNPFFRFYGKKEKRKNRGKFKY